MAKSEDVLALAVQALTGDRSEVESQCRRIMSKEKDSSALKKQLGKLLDRTMSPVDFASREVPKGLEGLVLKIRDVPSLDQLILNSEAQEKIFGFVRERNSVDLLSDYGLLAPNKILMFGPPGNGKTSAAGAIAKELDLPLYVLDFSTVVDGLMGKTSANIAKIFRIIGQQPCVLFLDEMETLLPPRDGVKDRQEVGEVSRIVSSLLLEMDRLPSHVVFVGATNYLNLLDKAVTRRFDYQVELPIPEGLSICLLVNFYQKKYPDIPFELLPIGLQKLSGLSYSDAARKIEQKCREWVLSQGNS